MSGDDEDDIAELRQRAQDALSRARLAVDPAIKVQWKALAEEYLARLAELEGTQHPDTPRGRAGKKDNGDGSG